ncbi:putative DNA modification/repair radical SAM protein [Sphingobacterium sp. UT-1RO-CII-1]|uniref:putative DNA modification/repair radical SAM protein n=1 Tax=Sphingobacterium sp. UT-1RO-CII-1 TaxID=2995225 RepID=UPI00227D4C11|nr:putative DNA modification/repair radical SAM protein [Sphingobacterium sp. UT-1RO-CII-1]MCY4778888.1 putative DNA modification/repair radical SAM protein [Sphingobacterium sp. UT-1RO-CII-1]
MQNKLLEKLSILADAAKYDVSCSSSGSNRKNKNKGLGNAGAGICHTYTEDGRCVSLLKILLTNHCIFDCAYCVSRRSNDVKRAAFTVQEVVDLTINFYRRNYIEGLFLSSGIFKNADYTMERLVLIAKKLRKEHNFNGYIHLKTIPGASPELLDEAGLYADRLSINLEIPTEDGLKLLAPEKNRKDMIEPMQHLKDRIIERKDERKVIKSSPIFAPAGQSTQMIIGASGETDRQIISLAQNYYQNYKLKRVYYSGYVPISMDKRLPNIGTQVPTVRENRLYQSDWLMRFYGFEANEIVNETNPLLDLDVDPKLGWALRNMDQFPIDINRAAYSLILRIPGIGVGSAKKIIAARRFGSLNIEHLKKLGIAINRAKYFIICKGFQQLYADKQADVIKSYILNSSASKYKSIVGSQLNLF